MAGDPMDSIDLHQSAGLCAQPEAAQDNPQNLLTARINIPPLSSLSSKNDFKKIIVYTLVAEQTVVRYE